MKHVNRLICVAAVGWASLTYGQVDPGNCGVRNGRCDPKDAPCTTSDGRAGTCSQAQAGCECVPHNICHLDLKSGLYAGLALPPNAVAAHLGHGDCRIDDGVNCTIDRCDPTLGCVHGTDDTFCDDGLFCTTEACTPEGCAGVSTCPPAIDGCIRVNNSCDEFNDICVNMPDDSLCDDGNPCTDEVCDAATGECSNPPVQCDDGNYCNGFEVCEAATGDCVIDSFLFCSDLSRCTADSCDPATGCVFAPVSCPDDGNACTTDACNAILGCQYLPIACDDQNACTDDSCDPAFGCVHTPKCPTSLCFSTTCDPDIGECNNTPVTCPDTDDTACTVGTCDPLLGCQQIPDSSLCNDGNPCSTDRCTPPTIQGGIIIPGGCINVGYTCNDDNLCTTDACDGLGGCTFADRCNDGNLCTNDSCHPGIGVCGNTPITCPDTDDTPCTLATCSGGVCGPQVPNNAFCNDGNPCTDDRCNPPSIQGGIIIPGGCISIGGTCDDGNACTSDSCLGGSECVHIEISCADDNPCTSDTCDPATGCPAPVQCDAPGQQCENGYCCWIGIPTIGCDGITPCCGGADCLFAPALGGTCIAP